jgi:N-acetylneuraminic acid mutarotase
MLKNFSIYFVLWILLLLLVEINCQMKPHQRSFHTATLIDGKLYILGGIPANKEPVGKDFFYLDVSVGFSTQNLLWQGLSDINIVPPHYQATSVKGGANNKILFLYGGRPIYDSEMTSLVYTFDPQSNSWTTPTITGDPIRKFLLKGIIDNNGKMYLWGGGSNSSNTVNDIDMLILDTINLSWGKGSLIGAPTPSVLYGAVLLPDQKIIYMGKQKIL